MADQSSLDSKYFIDSTVYNCPFCNRRNIRYNLIGHQSFTWSEGRRAHAYFVQCAGCRGVSLHLSYEELHYAFQGTNLSFSGRNDLDDMMFYHHPTSFFVIDSRIPNVLRELITEAEGCLEMNFLTGASACTRKAIYELVALQKAEGKDYEQRIKALASNFPHVAPDLFEVLAHITDMTSNKVHEESWANWDSERVRLLLETLRAILHDIYVVPDERDARVKRVRSLKENLTKDKKQSETEASGE